LQVCNALVEPTDCALVSRNIRLSLYMLRVGHRRNGRKLGADLRLELLDFDLSFSDFGTNDGRRNDGLGGEESLKNTHSVFLSVCFRC